MASLKILLMHPEGALGKSIQDFLESHGHTVRWVPDEEGCRQCLDQEIFDGLILEVKPEGNQTVELVLHAKRVNSFGIVICLVDPDRLSIALEAMEQGADGYIKKALDLKELQIALQRLQEYRSLVGANFYLRRTQDLIYRFDDIIGDSPALKRVLSVVKKVACSNASILIEGETGTGKELIAGAIHYNSARSDKPFIKVNCAALQDTLLESELFGHEKGAFTGADKQRIGRFEQANFGTIFLDEIADMSASTQAKVLRVLQEQEFERVGGTKTIKVDVRVISASNKDLREEILTKRFRDDLYYRLNVVNICIPPLRERREDILPLAQYFLRRFAGELSKKVAGFSPEVEAMLRDYEWPGNIRELRNTLERSVLLSEKEWIRPEDLSLHGLDGKGPPKEADRIRLPDGGIPLVEMEKKLILDALEKANWVQKEAAQYLGVSRRVMHYKIQKFGIRSPNWVKNK
jgi:DNA-binding NtrC family response regulator